jgi:hypothetical protein
MEGEARESFPLSREDPREVPAKESPKDIVKQRDRVTFDIIF